MPLEDEGSGLCSNSSSLAKFAAMRRASVVLHALFRMRRYGLPIPQFPVVGRALRTCGVPFAAALLAHVPT
jgi:hypothetical protein